MSKPATVGWQMPENEESATWKANGGGTPEQNTPSGQRGGIVTIASAGWSAVPFTSPVHWADPDGGSGGHVDSGGPASGGRLSEPALFWPPDPQPTSSSHAAHSAAP
jgi:hypothetical protein